MANTRTTGVNNNKPDPAPVRASARYWVKIVGAWDSTAAQRGVPCDGVQVDVEGAQLTGIPGGMAAGAVQNAPYSANVRYPDSYYTITSIGTATGVWLYWFDDPTV